METELLHSEPAPDLEGCVLYVALGPEACVGKSLQLGTGTAVIGGSPECELELDDPTVSRRHVEVTVKNDGVELRDLGSKNGVAYLGQRIQIGRLQTGSRFFLGRCGIDILPLGTNLRAIPPAADGAYGDMVGKTIAMRRLYTLLKRLEHSDAPVLIGGETGTGKELVARAIHDHGSRSGQPYVVIDCGSVQPELIRAEIFGYRKGAFTGANDDRAGAFEVASGGTVFLDEIGELPLALQPALLRVLETNQIQRVGESTPRPVNVRVVAATHRELAEEVRGNRFRQDLYYRLAVVNLSVPPLRDRVEDVPLLAEYFLRKISAGSAPPLAQAIVNRLVGYAWPGNVRELRNVIHRYVALGILEIGGEIIEDLAGTSPEEASRSAAAEPGELGPFKEAREAAIAAFERTYLVRLLGQAEGNISKASRVAEIDRKYLRELLRKHHLHGGGGGGE